jgi:hypothetical protein
VTFSHVHCRVVDLPGAVHWFAEKCGVEASFSDSRMAVLEFGGFVVILDAAAVDSVVTVGIFDARLAGLKAPRYINMENAQIASLCPKRNRSRTEIARRISRTAPAGC